MKREGTGFDKERDTLLQAKGGTMKSTCFGKWNDGHKENWGKLEKALNIHHCTRGFTSASTGKQLAIGFC